MNLISTSNQQCSSSSSSLLPSSSEAGARDALVEKTHAQKAVIKNTFGEYIKQPNCSKLTQVRESVQSYLSHIQEIGAPFEEKMRYQTISTLCEVIEENYQDIESDKIIEFLKGLGIEQSSFLNKIKIINKNCG